MPFAANAAEHESAQATFFKEGCIAKAPSLEGARAYFSYQGFISAQDRMISGDGQIVTFIKVTAESDDQPTAYNSLCIVEGPLLSRGLHWEPVVEHLEQLYPTADMLGEGDNRFRSFIIDNMQIVVGSRMRDADIKMHQLVFSASTLVAEQPNDAPERVVPAE